VGGRLLLNISLPFAVYKPSVYSSIILTGLEVLRMRGNIAGVVGNRIIVSYLKVVDWR
jgi:hypothetical protein